MIETILKILTDFDKVLWGPWTMIFIAAVAIYLTMKSRFFQFFKFSYIIRNTFGIMFKKPEDEAQQKMTPFQATATSLAGTGFVGMGNMAGVATALSVGGPGAIFWMLGSCIFWYDDQDRRDHSGGTLQRA